MEVKEISFACGSLYVLLILVQPPLNGISPETIPSPTVTKLKIAIGSGSIWTYMYEQHQETDQDHKPLYSLTDQPGPTLNDENRHRYAYYQVPDC